jgi:hypothetical protein
MLVFLRRLAERRRCSAYLYREWYPYRALNRWFESCHVKRGRIAWLLRAKATPGGVQA